MTESAGFTLNGRAVTGRSDESHPRGGEAARHRGPLPLLQGRHAAGRQLPRLRGRDQRRACARAVVLPHPSRRAWKSRPTAHGRWSRAEEWCWSLLLAGRAGERSTRSIPSSISGQRRLGGRASPASRRRQQPASRPVASRRSRSTSTPASSAARCVRAVPRRAGERRHRLRVPRRPLEDRLRPGRSDGRLHAASRAANACRRVRPGALMPARVRWGRSSPDKTGRFGLPVLRRRLPAHLSHQGQHDPLRRRARTAPRTRAACASRVATGRLRPA